MADQEIQMQELGPLVEGSLPPEDPNPKHRAPKRLYCLISTIFICGILLAVTGWQFNSLNVAPDTELDYTNCPSLADNSTTCSETIGNCTCQLKFQLFEQMHWPVVMQYGITNFHHDHRRYNTVENGTKNHIFNGKCKRF